MSTLPREYEPESVSQIMLRLQIQVQSVGDAYARIQDDLSSVQIALGLRSAKTPKMADIVRVTAAACRVTEAELLRGGNYPCYFAARALAMYLCRKMLLASLPMIGRHFDKHHTSVMHAIGRVVGNQTLKNLADEIEAKMLKDAA